MLGAGRDDAERDDGRGREEDHDVLLRDCGHAVDGESDVSLWVDDEGHEVKELLHNVLDLVVRDVLEGAAARRGGDGVEELEVGAVADGDAVDEERRGGAECLDVIDVAVGDARAQVRHIVAVGEEEDVGGPACAGGVGGHLDGALQREAEVARARRTDDVAELLELLGGRDFPVVDYVWLNVERDESEVRLEKPGELGDASDALGEVAELVG